METGELDWPSAPRLTTSGLESAGRMPERQQVGHEEGTFSDPIIHRMRFRLGYGARRAHGRHVQERDHAMTRTGADENDV